MFAISFDLNVADTLKHHPIGVSQAYSDIAKILKDHNFERIQGSVYITKSEDMAHLFKTFIALKSLFWFPLCVRDIRSFRIEQWSDFTSFIKEES